MIPYGPCLGDLDVHRTRCITFLTGDARSDVPLNPEDSEQISKTKESSIRTGIFTEWSFDEEARSYDYPQDDESDQCDLSCPEVEEGIIGIEVGEEQFD